MYEYRKLQPEEKKRVLEWRRQKGSPLHAPPHLNVPEHWYLITAATYEHRPIFRSASLLKFMETTLLEALFNAGFKCAAWVVQPNHYHVLLEMMGGAKDCQSIALKVHKTTSFYVNQLEGNKGRQVWYRYSDRMMRSEKHFQAMIQYIHFNPQKHGWCENYREWPWSSVHLYRVKMGDVEERDSMKQYDISTYGTGWDET